MKIVFFKDWNVPYAEFSDTWDGIMQAAWVIGQEHELHFITKIDDIVGPVPVRGRTVLSYTDPFKIDYVQSLLNEADAIICWGSLDRPWHPFIEPYKATKILCHAGGSVKHEFAKYFDAFACESQVYIDQYKETGRKAVRAFGTNTEIFRREGRSAKVIDAIYPASFCLHKNIELFGRAMGGKGLAIGNWNEQGVVSKALQIGLPIMRRVPSEALCDLYNMAHTTVMTGGPYGGAQRVVLESMACGTPVVVPEDNDKSAEFVRESGFGILVTPVEQEIRDAVEELKNNPPDPNIGIDYVKSKWTERQYAASILEAISIAKS